MYIRGSSVGRAILGRDLGTAKCRYGQEADKKLQLSLVIISPQYTGWPIPRLTFRPVCSLHNMLKYDEYAGCYYKTSSGYLVVGREKNCKESEPL